MNKTHRGLHPRSKVDEYTSKGWWSQHIVLLGTVGAVFALALIVISYPGIRFVSGGSLAVPLATVLAGSVYILVVSVHQPAAMFLMDPRGLWLQVL
ncbi:hypothetical protein ABT116_49265, partial [Streptomyces sp. NPDC002130]|uniref:hypothetical protein n=1 Tax=Streptomyces sp. NPDC002130 TaxID=3155568 RepID=UPI003330D35B